MRKFTSVLSVALLAVVFCGIAAYAATEVIIVPGEVYLSNSSINSYGHGKRDLSVLISEDGVLRPVTSSITWDTSSSDIVSVTSGTLTAGNSYGNAVVSASVTEGVGTCSVNVATNVTPVSNVSLEKASIDLSVGDTHLLVGTILPAGATPYYVDYKWVSSNNSVATVDNGLVTALSPGNATITFTELNDHGPLTAKCEVRVTRPFTGIAIDTLNSKSNIAVGTVFEKIALISTPSDAFTERDAEDVTWISSSPDIVYVINGSVNYEGALVGAKPGTATITAETVDGKVTPTPFSVTVNSYDAYDVHVTGVSVTPASASISVGETVLLMAAAAPSSAINRTVKWSSDKETVATVDSSRMFPFGGFVKGVGAGVAIITATTNDGEKVASSEITVNAVGLVHVLSVSITPVSASIAIGETLSLTATVSPDNATNKAISWSSSNTSVATVNSSSGVVMGVSAGSADIIVTTDDGGYTDTLNLTVLPPEPKLVITINTQPQSVFVVSGDISGDLSVAAGVTPVGTPLAYQWYSNTLDSNMGGTEFVGGTSSNFAIPFNLGVGAYYYYCVVSATGATSVTSSVATVTVVAPPAEPVITITTHPQDVSVISGSISGDLSVAANVTPAGTQLNYQWYSNSTNSNAGGAEIAGATSTSFTIPTDLTIGDHYYYCVVSAAGAVSKTSNAATVTVTGLPEIPVITITTQPLDTNVVSGSISGSLSIIASVTPAGTQLNYQWYSNSTNSNTGGAEISGATSSSFTIPTDLTIGGHYYYCVVSATGAVSKTSNAATVMVTEPTAVTVITITTQPQDADVIEGSISGSLSVSATVDPVGPPLTYQWYYNTINSSTNGQVIGGATIASYAIPVALLEGTYYYYCVVGAAGAASVTSNVARVSVTADVIVVTGVIIDPKSAKVEIGETLALKAEVIPSNATNKAVVWNSDNTAVADVDINGVVTALNGGTTIITVTTLEGGISDICRITVPASTPVDPQFPSDKDDVADKTGISSDDLEERDGKVYLKKKAAEEIAKVLLGAKEVNTHILPVFEGTVSSGGVAEVTFSITGKDLLASYADEINLIGLLFGGGGELFDYVNNAAEYGDGKFTLLLDGEIYEGKIDPNGIYELVVFIKDGGIFDLDGIINGKVISSVFLASVKKGGGDGSGGCNAYYLALALFGITPLILRKRN